MNRQIATQVAKLPIDPDKYMAAIIAAKKPEEVRPLESELERAENLMRESGLYTKDQVRVINETRMWAFWKLGKLLAKVERGRGNRFSQAGKLYEQFLDTLDPPLDKNRAQERQRAGEMPEPEFEKVLTAAHKAGDLVTVSSVVKAARPWWYKASRERKHKIIHASAVEASTYDFGPFPLIYADPPWKFKIYSEKGLDRTPDQHYPTLTDEEIIGFQIGGRKIADIAHRDAALLLWCTSSNIARALKIMEAWGFVYKSQAVWAKMKDGKLQTGMGLVFRNAHEVLLYGTRGSMPGPQYQPPSVFIYPRGRHSAKPPEIRTEIEKMYPDFNEQSRLELFARETVRGWTPYGYEQDRAAA